MSIEAHARKFVELKNKLVYSEGDKLDQMHFFRWEEQTSSWFLMPPLLQVELTSAG